MKKKLNLDLIQLGLTIQTYLNMDAQKDCLRSNSDELRQFSDVKSYKLLLSMVDAKTGQLRQWVWWKKSKSTIRKLTVLLK